ncbi:MAG: 50S ribosomal protein L11 methyltransferase [Bacillota bacterium]
MDDFWEIVLCMPAEFEDAAAAWIPELSPGGFEQREEAEGAAFVLYRPVGTDGEEAVLSQIRQVMSALTGDLSLRIRRVPATDWTERVREGMKPVKVGPVWVVPPWHAGEAAEDAVEVVISSVFAFGTGYHESTRLALRAAAEVICRREVATVLDVGCGTGILAIAALKLGVERAFACDIDPEAVRCAGRNALCNAVSDRLELQCCDVADLGPASWPQSHPLVVANLTAPVILARAGSLRAATEPGGTLVLSGIYRGSCDGVVQALRRASWRIDRELSEGDWSALVCWRLR